MRIMVNKWINLKHFISSQSVYSINHDGAMEANHTLINPSPITPKLILCYHLSFV